MSKRCKHYIWVGFKRFVEIGRRCKRPVTKGNYCWQHAEEARK